MHVITTQHHLETKVKLTQYILYLKLPKENIIISYLQN